MYSLNLRLIRADDARHVRKLIDRLKLAIKEDSGWVCNVGNGRCSECVFAGSNNKLEYTSCLCYYGRKYKTYNVAFYCLDSRDELMEMERKIIKYLEEKIKVIDL